MIDLSKLADLIQNPTDADILADLHELAMEYGDTGEHQEDIAFYLNEVGDFLRGLTEKQPEWLDKAGLIKKPVSCDKCGNKGSYTNPIKRRQMGFAYHSLDDTPCPCRDNPNSVYNFLKSIQEG